MKEEGRFIIIEGKLIQFLGGTKNVTIPEDVVSLGAGAFHGYSMESVYISDGVLEIGDNCFKECKNLREVRIPSSVQKISDTAFCGTSQVSIQTQHGSFAWKYAQRKLIKVISPLTQPTMPPRKVCSEKKEVSFHENLEEKPMVDNSSKKAYLKHKQQLENARILGCNIGARPWMMRNNFFGRASRFAQRVAQITDQDLLIRIAKEAFLVQIKCAAIKNIKSQEVLIHYSKHSSIGVRLASIQNLTDQEALSRLAVSDEWEEVRTAAVKKVKDENTIKEYLMKVDKEVIQAEVSKISSVKNLQELAIFARHYSVRKCAAHLLPPNLPERNLLNIAAEISEKMEPYAIEKFKDEVEKLNEKDSKILETVIAKYPFPGVRFLARNKAKIKPINTTNMEALLGSKTPSKLEMEQRAEIEKNEQILNVARSTANSFLQGCHEASERGETFYEMKISRWSNPAKTNDDMNVFVKILLKELSSRGFTRASVTKEAEFSTKYEYIGNERREVQELIGFSATIHTHW